ncbi:MAG TPA: PepSY domain-containing protein [Devosia sp.]|nr:PepSY domain-containing protein [Devosia sp.]
MLKLISAAAAGLLLMGSAAIAQDANRFPPPNAKKLSEIVAKVEQRQDFRFISEIDWDDGAYEVTYYTTDKAKVEIKYDPLTGEPK